MNSNTRHKKRQQGTKIPACERQILLIEVTTIELVKKKITKYFSIYFAKGYRQIHIFLRVLGRFLLNPEHTSCSLASAVLTKLALLFTGFICPTARKLLS